MYSSDEILKMLQDGTAADDIASSFETALNAAISQKAEADKKAAEEAAKAEKIKGRRDEKRAAVQDIIDRVNAMIGTFYSEIADGKPAISDEFADIIVDAMDEAYEEVLAIAPLLEDLLSKKAPAKSNDDKALADFMKAFNL